MSDNKRAYVAENAILRRIIKALLETIREMLDHSANLATWQAAYHIYKGRKLDRKALRLSKDEKFLMFSRRYALILSSIEDAQMYLDGNRIMTKIDMDRLGESARIKG